MREIKFRAWDEDIRKMLIYEPVSFEEDHLFEWDEVNSCNGNGWFLMQFTGLKDKNGKEIYEGDLIKFPHLNALYEIRWSDNYVGFNYFLKGESVAGFYEGSEKRIPNEMFIPEEGKNKKIDHQSVREVVGNIYENPELLK